MVSAISDFAMLEAGDRVLVAVSGGKDSSVMLACLEEIRQRAPFSFEIAAVMVDQKQPGFNAGAFADWVAARGITFHLIEEDTYSIVKQKTKPGKSFCRICSRLRRGILYSCAEKMGFNKIALGHHRDDLNETVLLNLFYGGQLAAMPPKLLTDDKRFVVLRPMCYLSEDLIAAYAQQLSVPIVPCQLCGSQDGLKRKKVKKLLQDLQLENPHVAASMLHAQMNIRASQLMDKNHWDFLALQPSLPMPESKSIQ